MFHENETCCMMSYRRFQGIFYRNIVFKNKHIAIKIPNIR